MDSGKTVIACNKICTDRSPPPSPAGGGGGPLPVCFTSPVMYFFNISFWLGITNYVMLSKYINLIDKDSGRHVAN